MRIYISGISGTGMGPLALMAKMAGIEVSGSDLAKGAMYPELVKNDIEIEIGKQDGEFLKKVIDGGLDWFVYTSALPKDHPELLLAREAGIKCTKRDELTAFLVEKSGLKMVAVAGTHGKTTTTAMIIFAALKLGLPVSYVVGTTLGFAPSGAYHNGDKFFIYEADEYDRNFLKFWPWLAVITKVSYDHPDIYPTQEDYVEAFRQFEGQCKKVIDGDALDDGVGDGFELAGKVRRKDAALAAMAICEMAPEVDENKVREILNEFPGVGRRFERLADGIYSDYAHHPEEIVATIDVARDEMRLRGKNKIVVIYEPHQNSRQHEVKEGYRNAFSGADKIYWLPTYLVRENTDLPILTATELVAGLNNAGSAEVEELGDKLLEKILKHQAANDLTVLMSAGPADEWLRKKLEA